MRDTHEETNSKETTSHESAGFQLQSGIFSIKRKRRKKGNRAKEKKHRGRKTDERKKNRKRIHNAKISKAMATKRRKKKHSWIRKSEQRRARLFFISPDTPVIEQQVSSPRKIERQIELKQKRKKKKKIRKKKKKKRKKKLVCGKRLNASAFSAISEKGAAREGDSQRVRWQEEPRGNEERGQE